MLDRGNGIDLYVGTRKTDYEECGFFFKNRKFEETMKRETVSIEYFGIKGW